MFYKTIPKIMGIFFLIITAYSMGQAQTRSDNGQQIVLSLFEKSNDKAKADKYFSKDQKGHLLNINASIYDQLLLEQPKSFRFELPNPKRDKDPVTIQLLSTEFLSKGAIGNINEGSYYVDLKQQGLHYWGSIPGEKTMVAFSFYPDAMFGFLSGEMGNYNLVKLAKENNGTYAFYQDEKSVEDFECAVEDLPGLGDNDLPSTSNSEIETQQHPITISLEASSNVFLHPNVGNGSVAQTINVMLHHFSIYAMFFANEEITIRLTEVLVETTEPTLFPGPGMTSNGGNCNDTTHYLKQFQDHRSNSYNADYAYLYVTTSCHAAGRAATIGGFCNSSNKSRMAVGLVPAPIPQGYELPTIHSRIAIFIHEFGHLFGSPHTRNCIWNGNGTALDAGPNCDANNCYTGPCPAYYTIMASGGGVDDWMDFNLIRGFGVQPGQRIRDRIIQNIDCFNYHNFCEANRYIFHRISDEFPVDYDAYYQALNIWADNSIVNTSKATYIAEEYIELLPGFNVSIGSEFEAIIVEDCLDINLSSDGPVEGYVLPQTESVFDIQNDKFTPSIVPNPSNGNFDIQLDKEIDLLEYQLFDLQGNVVLRDKKIDVRTFSIAGEYLPSGIYFLKMASAGEIVSSRIVIQ